MNRRILILWRFPNTTLKTDISCWKKPTSSKCFCTRAFKFMIYIHICIIYISIYFNYWARINIMIIIMPLNIKNKYNEYIHNMRQQHEELFDSLSGPSSLWSTSGCQPRSTGRVLPYCCCWVQLLNDFVIIKWDGFQRPKKIPHCHITLQPNQSEAWPNPSVH